MRKIIPSIDVLRTTVRINASIPWDTVEPFLDSARDIYLQRHLGAEILAVLEADVTEPRTAPLLSLVAKALGPFALWLGNAELSVRISDSGFTVEKSDKFLPAHDSKIAKVEESLEKRAFQYLDQVLEYLEKHKEVFPEWKNSTSYTLRGGNYIRSSRQFQQCGVDIEHSRLAFEHFRPLMTMLEERYITELLGDDLHTRLLAEADIVTLDYEKILVTNIRKFIACKTAELYTGEKSKRNRETDREKDFRPLIRPLYSNPAGSENFFAEQADIYLHRIQKILTDNAEALGLAVSSAELELKKEDMRFFVADANYTFNT